MKKFIKALTIILLILQTQAHASESNANQINPWMHYDSHAILPHPQKPRYIFTYHENGETTTLIVSANTSGRITSCTTNFTGNQDEKYVLTAQARNQIQELIRTVNQNR
jgi:hypothetical protein